MSDDFLEYMELPETVMRNRDARAKLKAKRKMYREQNLAKLDEAGIEYELSNLDNIAIIHNGHKTYEYTLTTDSWVLRTPKNKGIDSLLKELNCGYEG